jgi:TPR repeat protein
MAKNYTKAGEWFKKAMELGHVHAMYNLGILHWEGKYPTRDAPDNASQRKVALTCVLSFVLQGCCDVSAKTRYFANRVGSLFLLIRITTLKHGASFKFCGV